jgi:hypothetical protein
MLTLAAALTLAASSARADILSSDLAPGGTYNQSGAYLSHGDYWIGFYDQITLEFTPDVTAQLTQIELALTSYYQTDGIPDITSVSLDADNSGVPGANLEYWIASDFPAFGSTDSIFQTFVATSDITLTAGTQYWIVVRADASYDDVLWNENVPGGYSMPAYEVDGTPPSAVPEPTTVLLTLPGLLALCSLRRRCRA